MTKRRKLTPGTFTVEKLFEMIENDDREGLKDAFALKGFDVNMVNRRQETALHKAVMADKFEIIEILTGHPEIDIDAPGELFNTPLMMAAERGNWRLMELLLRKGACPIMKNCYYQTAYRYAAKRDDCEQFLQAYEHEKRHLDELFKALIWSSRFETLKVLSRKCVAKKYRNGPKIINRALSFAFKNENEKATKFLLVLATEKKFLLKLASHAIADLNIKRFKPIYERFLALNPTNEEVKEAARYLLKVAVDNDVILVAKYLLERGVDPNDSVGGSLLFWPCFKGNIKLINILLKHGSNINRTNSHGGSVLFCPVLWNNMKTLKILLKHGADPRIKDSDGYTPLLRAAYSGYASVFFELFKVDKDLGQRANDGITLFLAACRSGNLEIVKALLKAGACLTDVDNGNRNCLHFVVKSGNASDLLVFLSDKINFNSMITAADAEGNQPLGVLLSDSKKKSVTDLLLALPKLKEIIGVSKRVKIKNSLNSEQQEMCLICRDCYGKDDWTIVLPCQHVFHDMCYKEWSKMTKSCPSCRRPTFIIKK